LKKLSFSLWIAISEKKHPTIVTKFILNVSVIEIHIATSKSK